MQPRGSEYFRNTLCDKSDQSFLVSRIAETDLCGNLQFDIFWRKYDPVYASHTQCIVMLLLYSEEYFIEFSNTVVNSVCDHYPRALFVRNVVRINHATRQKAHLFFMCNFNLRITINLRGSIES